MATRRMQQDNNDEGHDDHWYYDDYSLVDVVADVVFQDCL
jgi:hypothetical protein